jgi:N-acetylmuramoyl-L-alanine amidase
LSAGSINSVTLSPLYEGRILGKRIIVDPEFGGTEMGYVSRNGFRSSDVTRKLARFLAGRLRSEGFDVVLAREGDESIHPSARVALANETGAEFYLVLRADSSVSSYCAYYPGNVMAKKYGVAVAAEFGDSIIQREEVSYIIQQTPCTAVIVNLISMHSDDPLDGGKFAEVADKLTLALINLFKK